MGANHSVPYRENFSSILYVPKSAGNISEDVKELFFAIKNNKSEDLVQNICSRMSYRQRRAVWLYRIEYKPFRKPSESTSVLRTASKMGKWYIIRKIFLVCMMLSRDVIPTADEKDGCILILNEGNFPSYIIDPVRILLHCELRPGEVLPPRRLIENKQELDIPLVDIPNGILLPPEETEENSDAVPADKVCIVCNTRAKNTANVPCGHISCCVGCIRQYVLTHKKTACMICKQPIEKVIKVYS